MNAKSMLRTLLLAMLLSMSLVPVLACGGGAGTPALIEDMADGKDLMVRATVVEVDDRGLNAILRVDAYLKGHGGEYLTLMRQPAALEIASHIRGYNTSCLYNGSLPSWSTYLQPGMSAYFGLRAVGNGTYSDQPAYWTERDNMQLYADTGISSSYSATTLFPIEDGQVTYHHLIDHTPTEFVLDTAAFEAKLLDYGANAPAKPDADNTHYPLKRFLTITTASGAHYRLNPDRSITRLSGDNDPLAVSNDGSHVAFRIDDTHIGLQYLAQHRAPDAKTTDDPLVIFPVEGQSVSFSPDSNFGVVWNDTQLTVYLFGSGGISGYGYIQENVKVIATADLTHGTPAHIAWSADSTTFAYEDTSGIWRWNIYQAAAPELIIPAGADTALLDISASGRYVRYGTNEAWKLLDTRTGKMTDNAIATPDESNLILIRPAEKSPADENRDCAAPLAETCPIILNQDGVTGWFWYKDGQIALLSCNAEKDVCYLASYSWRLAVGQTGWMDVYLDMAIPPVDAIAYDMTYHQPVMVSGGYLMAFDFYEASNYLEMPERLDTLDLSGLIDSPVVKLEWGQPVFYETER